MDLFRKKALEKIPCPICGTSEIKLIAKRGQFGLPCYVSICPFDGLVFLSPRWSHQHYAYFYQNEYDSYYRNYIFHNETEESKYKHIRDICQRIECITTLYDRQSVLDIGAGMGWSLQWLQAQYPNFNRVSAIESSKHCINNIINVVGAKLIATDVTLKWEESHFDLIIMRHVLEHFLDPISALKKVSAHISDNSVVYIATPDMMNPHGSLRYYWFRAVHTTYFSKLTLIKIASLAKLSPILINAEAGELWGLFRMSKEKYDVDLSKVYKKQMHIIRNHLRKNIYSDLKLTIKDILSRSMRGPR